MAAPSTTQLHHWPQRLPSPARQQTRHACLALLLVIIVVIGDCYAAHHTHDAAALQAAGRLLGPLCRLLHPSLNGGGEGMSDRRAASGE